MRGRTRLLHSEAKLPLELTFSVPSMIDSRRSVISFPFWFKFVLYLSIFRNLSGEASKLFSV